MPRKLYSSVQWWTKNRNGSPGSEILLWVSLKWLAWQWQGWNMLNVMHGDETAELGHVLGQSKTRLLTLD